MERSRNPHPENRRDAAPCGESDRVGKEKTRRDFSLRRPTRLQEQTWKQRRRPAPFERTVGWRREKEGTMYRAPTGSKKQIPRFARDDKSRSLRVLKKGLGVEVLFFEVGVEEDGEIGDEDAAAPQNCAPRARQELGIIRV